MSMCTRVLGTSLREGLGSSAQGVLFACRRWGGESCCPPGGARQEVLISITVGALPWFAVLTAPVLHCLPTCCQEALGYLFLRSFCWPHGASVRCLEQGRAETPSATWLWESIVLALRVLSEGFAPSSGSRGVLNLEWCRRCCKGKLFLRRNRADAGQGPCSSSRCCECGQCLKLCCSSGTLPVPRASCRYLNLCTDPVLAAGRASELQTVPFLRGSWIPSEAEAQGRGNGHLLLQLLCRCALLSRSSPA